MEPYMSARRAVIMSKPKALARGDLKKLRRLGEALYDIVMIFGS